MSPFFEKEKKEEEEEEEKDPNFQDRGNRKDPISKGRSGARPLPKMF